MLIDHSQKPLQKCNWHEKQQRAFVTTRQKHEGNDVTEYHDGYKDNKTSLEIIKTKLRSNLFLDQVRGDEDQEVHMRGNYRPFFSVSEWET